MNAHQQEWGVDVDVLKDSELLLHLHGQKPRSVELSLHPVANAPMLPLEGGGQGPERAERGERRGGALNTGLWKCVLCLKGCPVLCFAFRVRPEFEFQF